MSEPPYRKFLKNRFLGGLDYVKNKIKTNAEKKIPKLEFGFANNKNVKESINDN